MPTKQFNQSQYTDKDVKILEQTAVYQGYFRVDKFVLQHRLFNGNWSQAFEREVFERGHAAAALLYDPDLHKIVLIEQFRIGVLRQSNQPWLLELVAGIIEPHETPEEVVKREVSEESGLIPVDLIPIYNYWASPGATTERVNLYCARIDASHAGGIHGLGAENEDIRVWVLDVKEVYKLLAEGRICNATTIIGIQWFQLNEAQVRNKWVKKL